MLVNRSRSLISVRIYSLSDFENQFLSLTITNGSLFFPCSGIMVWVSLFEVCCVKIVGIYVVILHICRVPLFGAQSAVTEKQYSTSCSTHQWCLCAPIYREIGSIAAKSVQMRTENRLETKQHMFKIETMLDICVVINC